MRSLCRRHYAVTVKRAKALYSGYLDIDPRFIACPLCSHSQGSQSPMLSSFIPYNRDRSLRLVLRNGYTVELLKLIPRDPLYMAPSQSLEKLSAVCSHHQILGNRAKGKLFSVDFLGVEPKLFKLQCLQSSGLPWQFCTESKAFNDCTGRKVN